MTTTTHTASEDRRYLLRAVVLAVIAALAVTAVVLAVQVASALHAPPAEWARAGDGVRLRVQPYGRQLTVLTPGSRITLVVGDPVETVGHELLDVGYDYDDPRYGHDLAAPDGGTLVPVSWQTRVVGGFAGDGHDKEPIHIRLVAADQTVDLDTVVLDGTDASLDAFDPTSEAVALDHPVDPDDLAIEVEYDGVTQTAHVGSGEVDAGVAQALYDGDRDYATGCASYRDGCELRAADPASPRRPAADDLSTSYLTVYPYDAALGWAPAGSLWAAVRPDLLGADSVRDAAGRSWGITHESAPVLTLDGARPVRREGLAGGDFDTTGRVVFRVDADAVPRELEIAQVITLAGRDAPPDVPVRARLRLTPVG